MIHFIKLILAFPLWFTLIIIRRWLPINHPFKKALSLVDFADGVTELALLWGFTCYAAVISLLILMSISWTWCHQPPPRVRTMLVIGVNSEQTPHAEDSVDNVAESGRRLGYKVTVIKGREVTKEFIMNAVSEYDEVYFDGPGGLEPEEAHKK